MPRIRLRQSEQPSMTAPLRHEATFDYAVLPEEIANEARSTAGRIKARLRRTASDIVATGEDLLRLKDRLGHGRFLPWVDAEFGMSADTAGRYMNVARNLGGK